MSGIKARLVMLEIRNDDLVDLSETITQTLYTDKNYERTVQRPWGYTVRHTLGKANLPCRASLRHLLKDPLQPDKNAIGGVKF